MEEHQAVVIGAGPAGLMAAETLAAAGARVLVAEAMPTIGRKFLMAGKSGLNLTKDEAPEAFRLAFGAAEERLRPALAAFGPAEVAAWARALGQAVFTGSSGRVFPVAMKASPLLRAWAERLAAAGVAFRTRAHWQGWDGTALAFATAEGPLRLTPDVTVLALGGASWPRLGSDGTWADLLAARGVAVAPFRPANMGFDVAWSAAMQARAGEAVKNVVLRFGADSAAESVRGEFVVTRHGIEGGAVYALSRGLREAMGPGGLEIALDLAPDRDAADLARALARTRPGDSLANRLRKAARLSGACLALLREAGPVPAEPAALAARIKALPLRLLRPRPLAEAISTAGGVAWGALDDDLMLRRLQGVYCAGEMIDWEAPTGGYLLTACIASGRFAGRAAARRLGFTVPSP